MKTFCKCQFKTIALQNGYEEIGYHTWMFFDTNFKNSYQTENCNWPLFRPVAKGNPNKSTNKQTPKPQLWLIWHNSAQSNRHIGYVYICFKVSLITTPSTYPTLIWKAALLEAQRRLSRDSCFDWFLSSSSQVTVCSLFQGWIGWLGNTAGNLMRERYPSLQYGLN